MGCAQRSYYFQNGLDRHVDEDMLETCVHNLTIFILNCSWSLQPMNIIIISPQKLPGYADAITIYIYIYIYIYTSLKMDVRYVHMTAYTVQ